MKQTKKVMSMVLCLAMLLSMMTAMTTMTAGAATETIVDLKFNLDEGEVVDTDQDQMDDRGEADADEEWVADGGHDGGAMTYTAKTDTPTKTDEDGNVSQVQTRFFNGPKVKFEKNKTYTISFWAKASVDGVTATFFPTGGIYSIDLNGTNQTYGVSQKSYTLSTQWSQYTFTFSIKDFQAESKGATQGYVESSCVMANFKNYKEGTVVYVDDFTVTVTYDEAVSLDLTGTEKTVLSADDPENNTTKIVAKATDVFGNVIENPAVTYTSDNEEVATVAADGTVTAHKNGVAIITAKSGEVEKSIIIMVGTKGKYNNFDSAPPASVSDDTTQNTIYPYSAALDTTTYREGSGAWKFSILDKITDRSDPSNGYPLMTGLDSTAQTFSYWFYDDGTGYTKGRFHLRNGTMTSNGGGLNTSYDSTADKGRLSLLLRMNLDNNKKYTTAQWDNGLQNTTTNSPDRSEGWHQVVVVNTFETVTAYLDGEIYATGSNTFAGMYFNRFDFYSERPVKSVTDEKKVLFDSVIIDDFVAVDTDSTVTQHTVTVESSENGAVKNNGTTVSEYTYNGKTYNYNTITVYDGSDLTLTLIPEDGYEAKVTVDDQAVAVQEDNTVTISNITADKTVDVSFEKIITEPSISGSSTDYIVSQTDYVHNNANHFAYVAYYKAAVPANHTVKSMGMNFGDGTNTVPLTVDQWTKDYMFGVRVFGEAVKEGKQYTFQGFAVMEDGDKEETTVTTDTVTK